jgi:hypothetical protein
LAHVVRHSDPPARPVITGPSVPAIIDDVKPPTALSGSRHTSSPSERPQLAAPVVVVATRINKEVGREVGISPPEKSTLPTASQQHLEAASSRTSSTYNKKEGLDDGWGNDDDVDLEEETTSDPSDQSLPPSQETLQFHKLEVVPDWEYNPQDDIIPTRKRWVNPRSGMRELRQLSSR